MPDNESGRLPERVVLLAPRSGTSGVGDHADDLVTALQPHVEVVELRHGPPGADRVIDMWRLRRALRDVLAASPPDTVVHGEMSGGASPSFWATFGLRGVRRTATFHDAPRPVWFPPLTRLVRRLRIVSPILMRAMSPVWVRLERRAMRDVDVVVLTTAGAEQTRALGMGSSVVESRLIAPARPAVPPPWERPLAVGLFGHVYRGKGFHLVPRLRALLPDDIEIRIAGRGTESLSSSSGVTVLGPVEGADEDAYFASIRVLLLPYNREPVGGICAMAGSAAQLQGAAYDTPAIALAWPTMDELAAEGGCRVAADLDTMAKMAAALVRSDEALRSEHERLRAFLGRRTADRAAEPYLRLWARP